MEDDRVAGAASLRRMAALFVLSIPLTAEMAIGEVLFAGHIVFLVRSLGFAWGLVLFSAIWAGLGLAILVATDFLWPRLGPLLKPLLWRLADRATALLRLVPAKASFGVLGIAGLLVVATAATTSVDSQMGEWAIDHRGDVVMFIVVAVVVSAILIALAQVGRGLANWVRSVAETAGPIRRSLGALASMTVLGPALSWPLLRLLRYSRRSVYALTLLAGPLFGAVWVPLYGLGVWSLVQGLI
jgi:hypothetical protein